MDIVVNKPLARVELASCFSINQELICVSCLCRKNASEETYHILSLNNGTTSNVRDIAEWLFVGEQICVQARNVSKFSNTGF